MIEIEKLLNADALLETFPIPLPSPIKQAIVKTLPFLMKKHHVHFEGGEQSEVKGVRQYRITAVSSDGTPLTAVIFVGPKPEVRHKPE